MPLLDDPLEPLPVGGSSVDVSGLCKRYGRRWAVADIGFVLPASGSLLVAGHNGSGKSTLLRLLSTASRCDRGMGTVTGASFDRPEEIRRRVGFLSHASFLYESLTALENLTVTAKLLGRDASREALRSWLDRVGLASRADDPISAFSAGMRKRLSIARLLIQRPSLILLDEPYGALDPEGFALMDELIASAQKRHIAIIVATHQIDRASEIAQFAMLLREGRVAWSGRSDELPRVATDRSLRVAEEAV